MGQHFVSQEAPRELWRVKGGSGRVPGRSRRVTEGVLGESVKCMQFVNSQPKFMNRNTEKNISKILCTFGNMEEIAHCKELESFHFLELSKMWDSNVSANSINLLIGRKITSAVISSNYKCKVSDLY